MSPKPTPPADGRLGELAQQLQDEHTELGPLDRDDLRAALSELIDRRIADTPHAEKVAA
jgi:hypothetical protein